jgi:hypothetical protein
MHRQIRMHDLALERMSLSADESGVHCSACDIFDDGVARPAHLSVSDSDERRDVWGLLLGEGLLAEFLSFRQLPLLAGANKRLKQLLYMSRDVIWRTWWKTEPAPILSAAGGRCWEALHVILCRLCFSHMFDPPYAEGLLEEFVAQMLLTDMPVNDGARAWAVHCCLHIAAKHGRVGAVRVLVALADKHQLLRQHRMLAALAAKVAEPERREVLLLVRQSGYALGCTCLHTAALHGNTEVVMALLEAG